MRKYLTDPADLSDSDHGSRASFRRCNIKRHLVTDVVIISASEADLCQRDMTQPAPATPNTHSSPPSAFPRVNTTAPHDPQFHLTAVPLSSLNIISNLEVGHNGLHGAVAMH